MSGKPFDRAVINPRERPLSSDFNQAQSNSDRTIREILRAIYLARVSTNSDASAQPITGFVGEALKPRPISPLAMAVRVPAGFGFFYDPAGTQLSIGGISAVDDLCVWAPLILNSDYIFTPSNGPSSPATRIDIIEVNMNRRLTDTSSREQLDPTSGKFVPNTVQKTLAWDLDGSIGLIDSNVQPNSTSALSYKMGVPGTPGTAPPTTPGYTQIAQIAVGSGVTTLDADVMQDLRKMLFPAGSLELGFNATYGTPPTFEDVTAPPGVQVVCTNYDPTGSPLAAGSIDVYVVGGDLSNNVSVPVNPVFVCQSRNAYTLIKNAASIVTISSTVQTLLADATKSNPATKFAVGQPALLLTLQANTPGSPQKYAGLLSARGGF